MLLREMYLAEPKRTISFIEKNYDLFIREGLRYAIEKMPENEKIHVFITAFYYSVLIPFSDKTKNSS